MASMIDRVRGWLNRPALERAQDEQGLTPAERENEKLDFESRKDDAAVLHGAVAEQVLHFDDDSKAPKH
jgi:hypothetical protein